MKKIIYLLFILCLFQSLVYSQNKKDTSLVDNKDYEIILLKQRNQDLLSFQDKLVDTVYWSLGFSVTFLVLFLGVNIYFTRNKYNDDRKDILKHIDDTLSSKVNEILIDNKNFQIKKDEELKEISKRLEKNTKEIVEVCLLPFDSKFVELKKSVHELNIQIYDHSIDVMKLSGSKSTLLETLFEAAKLVKETYDHDGYSWKISSYLSEMEKLMKEGVTFSSFDLPDVTQFIDSLSTKFTESVHSFRETLRKNRV